MEINDAVNNLKIAIKTWEHEFFSQNNRQPTKDDIKANRDISAKYKEYRKLKTRPIAQLSTPQKKSSKDVPHIMPIQAHTPQPTSPLEDPEDEEEDELDEFGPTPQLNGKIMGLFEILNTPERTPVKRRRIDITSPPQTDLSSFAKVDNFKTPTKKPIKIEITGTPKQNSTSLTSKLMQESAIGSFKIPTTPTNKYQINNSDYETPSYLSTSTSGNILQSITTQSNNLNIPDQTFKFSLSPSPLKPQRQFGKKLSTIFNELKAIQEESKSHEISNEDMDAMLEDFENDFEEENENENEQTSQQDTTLPGKKWKKKTTQKRTTRRYKIKARLQEEKDEVLDHKNIHKVINKLEKQDYKNLKDYLEDDNEEDFGSSESSGDERVVQDDSKTKNGKMIKPMSQNYQRLKINDARSKKFKSRMKGRR